MNRDELGRAIKAACANLDEPRVIVLGSQSILGSFDTTALPPAAFLSREVDILPLSGITDPPAVEDKLLLLDARLGEGSPFHMSFGFYVEGIHKDVVVLPRHWEHRLVHFIVDDDTSTLYGRTGLCLDPVDLCVSKTIAGREKDYEFVAALVAEQLVRAADIRARIDSGIEWPPTYTENKDLSLDRARNWLSSLADPTATSAEEDPASNAPASVAADIADALLGHPRSVEQMLNSKNRGENPSTSAAPPDTGPTREAGPDLSQ